MTRLRSCGVTSLGLLLWLWSGPAAATCAGDCGGDGEVTVDELLVLVNIALEVVPVTRCPAGDVGDDGRITVDDILAAVNRTLRGCPAVRCAQPPPGMVAWYAMEDVGGPEVRDEAGNDNTGTAADGLLGYPDGPSPAPGMVGGALMFDGASNLVRVADAPNLDFGRGDLSIDAWVRVAADAGSGVRPIVDKRDVGANGGVRGYQVFLFNGRLGMQLADAANGNNTCARSAAACTNYVANGPDIADGRSHHLAVTVRRSGAPALTLYVDGTAVLTDADPRAGSVANDGDLLIARSEIGGAFFAGWIDELEVFDRALDAAEVNRIFAAGAAGKCRALDHFLCYRTAALPAQPPFDPVPGVRVEDQFGAAVVDVEAPVALCAPVDKNGEAADAPAHADHLRHYPVTPRGELPMAPGQKIVNQFGTLFLDVLAPTAVLVPTAKNLTSVPAAPRAPAVDHFLCHPVQRPRGAPPFTPVPGVRVADQFGARLIDLIAPTRLCAPADKRGEDPGAPGHAEHLLCYRAQLSPRVIQSSGGEAPPTVIPQAFESPVAAIYTNDQFGPETMQMVDVDELCVPSRKNPPGDAEEPLNCDDGLFCTEDRVVEYEPEADFDPPPTPTPNYTPPKERGCVHEWKTGAAYGSWAFDQSGANISPCCELSSDCDDGDPCTHDVCIASEHRCHFEALDPAQCALSPIAPVMAAPASPCVDDATEARLCDIQCVPGQDGEDCPPPQRPLELRPGSADVHHHLFDEDAFGARWRHGKAGAPLHTCDGSGYSLPSHGRVATLVPVLSDLAGCVPALPLSLLASTPSALLAYGLASGWAPLAFSELIGKEEGTWGDTGLHLKRRVPGTGWPRWDAMVHQRGQRNGVLEAHQDGLSLLVVTVGGFAPFCELLPASNNYGCDEMADVERQLALAHQFAAANSSWVQIALGPQDAVNIINNGKLAMVLAIETTDLFNTLFADPSNPPDAAAIGAVVQKYYDPPYDVRAIQLAHETDNGFAGAALINPLFEVFQFADNRYGPSCTIDSDCARARLGFDVYEDADGVCKNARGLTAAGELLVQALMDRGMLIDLAHLPERGILRTYQLAKQNAYYPLFHSHTKLRELEVTYGGKPQDNHYVIEHSVPAWVVQKIRRTGGLIGLRIGYLEQRTYTPSGIANTCQGSSRSLAQAYEFARQGLKVPIALGTDLNAFTQNTRPRFTDRTLPGQPRQNPNGACAAGFRAEGICEAKAQTNRIGTAYDTLGLADTGYTIDVLDDLEAVGLSAAQVAPLRNRSAEMFIRMWQRANDLPQPRNGPADLANDVDISGIAPYDTKAMRELNYPQASCVFGAFKPRYCPNSSQLGESCRFDGECVTPLKCGGFQPLCGLPEGTCVCHGKDLGCPSGQYCKLRNPLTAADNECRAKKDSGQPCLTKKECKSDQCKFTLNPFGPHCG
ncbi:MAG: LamG-like jellyroll fold domain-containing protein [Candidatus Binatia bacterium]